MNAKFLKTAKDLFKKPPRSELKALQRSIGLLAQNPQTVKGLPGQPFDSHLLALSPLYRQTRQLYLERGGIFNPALLSSGRTLSSASLLSNSIDYSPIEKEMIWVATDSLEKKNPQSLLHLRTYCTSVFHEQNHRTLWKLLPPPPKLKSAVRMYLNFSESLVIAMDMALADELGQEIAQLFYLTGVLYHPTDVTQSPARKQSRRKKTAPSRAYRNYLHAIIYATYLNLEMFEPDQIHKAVHHLYPNLAEFLTPALERSLKLDRQFVEKTNPFWQNKHRNQVSLLTKTRSTSKQTPELEPREALQLPDNPLDNRLLYLWAEKWMDTMNI